MALGQDTKYKDIKSANIKDAQTTQSKSGRILIFSKNYDFMTSVRGILSEFGYLTVGFISREDALKSLKSLEKKTFDFLVIDIDQQEEENIKFLKKAMKIDPDLMCIIIVDHGEFQAVVEAMKTGVFDYLFKPFKIEILLITISRAMEIRRLRKAKDLYYSIFADATEGIYLKTPEGQYITANPALADLLGYESSDELITKLGTNITNETYVEPDRHKEIIRILQKKDIVTGFESQIYRKDGNRIWISENVRAVRDPNGNLLYYRGTIEDITRRRQNEEALRQSESHFRLCAEKAEKNTGIFLDMIDELCDSYRELDQLFINFAKTMVNMLDEKNKWTKGHSDRVALYSEMIAKEIGIDREGMKKLRLAALLHDIGRMGTFDYFLHKPSRFTERQYELVKKHPVNGAKILENIGFLDDLIPFVRHHHERMDGKGYPDGLKGEKIPFYSRILHVADSFDSMTSDRPHRKAPGKEYALSELKRCKGSQFDPKVIEAALKVL
ncbi:MAG: HD domain-containing protein [Nitrospirae bacterium]|nr:HD domain-containing protein [Nitrospirota bacterium]